MKEKVIELIIYWVTGAYKEDKYTKDTCIEVADLLLMMLDVDKEKAENLINIFQKNNPVHVIYRQLHQNTNDEIRKAIKDAKESIEKYEFDENIFRNIETEKDVEKLSKKISEI